MASTNLGRVQGAGMFTTTAASGTSISSDAISPTNISPLVGDSVIFPNGDVRRVTAVSGGTITCGDVVTSIKGETGPAGPQGTTSSIVKTAAEWESQNPVLGAGVFGYDSTNDITKIGDGTTAWSDLNMVATKPKPTFADSDWVTIAELSANGQAQSFFSVGDEKTIELTTGEQVTFVILGFNHDDLTGGGKAGITIGMKNLLATKYRMNSSNTNAGGWDESEMRTSTMATLLSQLPADLRNVIKQVNKKATAMSQSTTTITTSADKLFLFALAELASKTGLENSTSTAIKNNAATYEQEGTQYEYFKNTVGDADINKACPALVKKLSNGSGSADTWWLRSPALGDRAGFWYVLQSGGVYYLYANSSYGVSFGFCV